MNNTETNRKSTIPPAPFPAFSMIFTVCLIISLAIQGYAQSGSSSAEAGNKINANLASGSVLYVYDEVNEQSVPYIEHFHGALSAYGISYDEVAAADLLSGKAAVDPSDYDYLIVHGMVMAFNSKSPVRDWLKKKPDLTGIKVSLFVTANRWFLANLYGQLTELFEKDGAELVDAVSMATKETADSDERAAVSAHVARFAAQ